MDGLARLPRQSPKNAFPVPIIVLAMFKLFQSAGIGVGAYGALRPDTPSISARCSCGSRVFPESALVAIIAALGTSSPGCQAWVKPLTVASTRGIIEA